MSIKSRKVHRSNHTRRTWKLIDDHSGMEISSANAVIDHKGRITSKANFDPIHYIEMPINYPIDEPIPYARPENPDFFYTPNYLMTSTPPNTYNDRFVPQHLVPNLTEMTSATNPKQDFSGNNLPPPTFGVPLLNTGNDIVEVPTTLRYRAWGDSYDMFNTAGTFSPAGANLLDKDL